MRIFQTALRISFKPSKIEHFKELRLGIVEIVFLKFFQLPIALLYGYLIAVSENGSYFPDLRKIYPKRRINGKRNAIGITETILRMQLSVQAVNTILLLVKIIEAGFILDHQKYQQA